MPFREDLCLSKLVEKVESKNQRRSELLSSMVNQGTVISLVLSCLQCNYAQINQN